MRPGGHSTGSGQAAAWPQDVAVAPRAVAKRPAVPFCEARMLGLDEVKGWFEVAAVGETLVYATGPRLIQGAVSAWVRDKALAGLLHPTQPRQADCIGYEYRVKKLGHERAPARPPEEPDAALEAIFAAIERAAEAGLRCPSDAELAIEAGLPRRAQAQWRFAKLRKARRIESAPVAPSFDNAQDRPIGRVVTILATGKRTLAPKGWRA